MSDYDRRKADPRISEISSDIKNLLMITGDIKADVRELKTGYEFLKVRTDNIEASIELIPEKCTLGLKTAARIDAHEAAHKKETEDKKEAAGVVEKAGETKDRKVSTWGGFWVGLSGIAIAIGSFLYSIFK